jgi:hypothetical protein
LVISWLVAPSMPAVDVSVQGQRTKMGTTHAPVHKTYKIFKTSWHVHGKKKLPVSSPHTLVYFPFIYGIEFF